MMYRYYLTFFVLFTISCNQAKQETVETKAVNKVIKNDTVYCDFSNTVLKEKTAMYNLEYESVINTFLGDKDILYKTGNTTYVCKSKKISLALLKEKDTIYNVHVNMELVDRELKDFYKRYSGGVEKNNLPKIDPMVYNQNFKLDSINLAYARTNHLYYTCYLYDYNGHEKYSVNLGINYLDYKEHQFLINQLEKL